MTRLLLEIPDSTDVDLLMPLLRRLNIAVLPQTPSVLLPGELERLHAISDAGTDLPNNESFLNDFEQSCQDRPLPFRD